MPPLLAEYCGVAQLVERRIVNPVVVGSSPTATAKLNNFRTNDLTESSSSASSTVSAQVSNRASNRRRDDIVSLRLERDDLREGVLAFTPAHGPQEPHLAPVAPHISEELWQRVGGTQSVHKQSWPTWSAELAAEDEVTVAV